MTPEHDRLSREFKIEIELLFDANVVANWAIGESNRFRAAAIDRRAPAWPVRSSADGGAL